MFGKGFGRLREPFSILGGGENVHTGKILWSVRGRLAKWCQKLGRNKRRNVVLLKSEDGSGFTRCKPRWEAATIHQGKDFLAAGEFFR